MSKSLDGKQRRDQILKAWRQHVKSVASRENMKYGKETMKKAKTGKYGEEWDKIKQSIGKVKKGGDNGVMNDDNMNDDNVADIDVVDVEVDDVMNPNPDGGIVLGGKRKARRRTMRRARGRAASRARGRTARRSRGRASRRH